MKLGIYAAFCGLMQQIVKLASGGDSLEWLSSLTRSGFGCSPKGWRIPVEHTNPASANYLYPSPIASSRQAHRSAADQPHYSGAVEMMKTQFGFHGE
jgi:hypothetical protein